MPLIESPIGRVAENKDGLRVPPQEIERKWLVSEIPDVAAARRCEIVQGYLALMEDGSEVRVRRSGHSFWQTVKSAGDLARDEIEIPLTLEQFEVLWPHTQGRRIDKIRYEIGLEHGAIAHLDLYNGSLSGFAVVEVEFSSRIEAQRFTPPSWFGREVTQEPGYKNKNLATHGLPRG